MLLSTARVRPEAVDTHRCNADNFCPDAPATRGQMALFLAKALGLDWNGPFWGPAP